MDKSTSQWNNLQEAVVNNDHASKDAVIPGGIYRLDDQGGIEGLTLLIMLINSFWGSVMSLSFKWAAAHVSDNPSLVKGRAAIFFCSIDSSAAHLDQYYYHN